MRVTNSTLVRTFLDNVNRNLNAMRKYQDQLSSGKEIRRPSDDPFGTVRTMGLHKLIDRNDQYLSNIDGAISWLNTTDTALGQIGDSLMRIQELVTAAANGTNSDEELNAYREEILQKIEEIVQSGNTKFDDKYIFGGNITTGDPPFELDKSTAGQLNFKGDSGVIKKEISPGVTIDINVTGTEILGVSESSEYPNGLSETLNKIVKALEGGETEELSKLIGDIKDHFNNVLNLRSRVGAKYNRMESVKYKNEEETFNMTEMLSKIEDIDLAEKVMEYAVMETVYMASLMTNAKILQPSLVDFLS